MLATATSFSNSFLYQINQLEGQQANLQNQATTGLKLTNAADNPAAMNQVLNLQTEDSANTQYQSNITAVQRFRRPPPRTPLTGLQTLVEKASEIATDANGVTSPTQLASYATQVSQLIQQALQIANTQDSQGNYIFGGTNTGTAPFSATTDASGNITGIKYNGNTSVAETEIAPGVTVTAQSPGENNSGFRLGRRFFADSRSGADIFNHLIALQQDLASGNTSAISSTDSANLNKDEDHVVAQISSNGVLQSSLNVASNLSSQNSTTIETQMSNDTNADLSMTLTKLTQNQTAYQAALETGTMIMSVSLVNYLE